MESAIQISVIERVRRLVWQNSMNMIGLIAINALTVLFSALIVTFVVSFVNDFQIAIMQLMKTWVHVFDTSIDKVKQKRKEGAILWKNQCDVTVSNCSQDNITKKYNAERCKRFFTIIVIFSVL